MREEAEKKKAIIAELIKNDRLSEITELSKKCERLCSSIEQALQKISPSLEKNSKEFLKIKDKGEKIRPELEKVKKANEETEKTMQIIKNDIEKRTKETRELVKELEVMVISKDFIEGSIHKIEQNNKTLIKEVGGLSKQIDRMTIKRGAKFDELLKKAESIGKGLYRTDGQLKAMEKEFIDVQVMLLNLER